MTAAEIYQSMDACIESCRNKEHSEILPTILPHASELGRKVGRTGTEILLYYFSMRNLGEHWSD